MTLSAVKRWRFPIIVNRKKKLSANDYYKALMVASGGFYPISVNNLIHSGIHFDKLVLKKLGDENERKVYCIADGEVIAYRVDDSYQKVDYGDRVGFFSTGFVLVRHLLEMEQVEEKTADTEETKTTEVNTTTDESSTVETNKIKQEKQPGHQLYFYSLYMHMADTAFYEKNPEEPAPAFWEQDIYRVISDHKDLDTVEGLNIRYKPDNSKNDSILAVLQVGTKVNLNLDLHDENHNWYAVTSLAEGYSSIPELKSIKYTQGETQIDILGWIFIGKEMTSLEFEILELNAHEKLLSGQLTKISILKKEFNVNLVKSKGLRVRNDFKNSNDKKILSMLPPGTQIKISGDKKPKNYVELIAVIRDGKPTIPLSEEKKKVWFDCLENISRGKKYNEVVVLDTPFPIKAGDLIGHIGHNHSYEEAILKTKDKTDKYIDINTLPLGNGIKENKFNPYFHIECFTCDDLPNFIKQTQAEASNQADEDKTLLGISKTEKLLKSWMEPDTVVGTKQNGTEIKVISNDIYVNWLQVEIQTSETEKKMVWIKNDNDNIAKKVEETRPSSILTKLDEKNEAWSKHPLQINDLANNSDIIDTPLLLNINGDNKFETRYKRAIDEQGNLWFFIDKALDNNNASIHGWLLVQGDNIKKTSCWEWFDFKQIKETATLKEIYLDIKNSLSRNDASLESYKPIVKETLTILDKQYHIDQKKYAKIEVESFNGIIEKPQLFSALSRFLIHYESEWYSEIDADGKMPKWETLNSEMNESNKNLLDYLQTGDETKLNVYLNQIKQSKDSSIEANKYKKERATISSFPIDYEDEPELKLNKEQLTSYKNLKDLELDVIVWEKEKEKIKKLLWWEDVVKGLAIQNQSNQVNTTNKDSTSKMITQPATLNPNGKAWFIHPIALINYFTMPSGLITYHVYHNGKIERHIPINLIEYDKVKYQYIYHDINNNLHKLGTFEYVEIKNNYLSRSDKRYGDTEYIHLIDLRDVPQEYEKHGLKYRFNVDTDQKRYFMNRDTLASFFGAMLEVNFTDISCNGFSTEKGESGVSKSHKNGYHGDFKYLRKDKILYKGAGTSLNIKFHPEELDVDRQNQWIDALYKFGWTNMLGWSYSIKGKVYFLNHIPKDTKNHEHHLHVEYYDLKKVEEIKE